MENNEFTNSEKLINLYKFLQEFWAIKQKSIINEKNYKWACQFKNIPHDPKNIVIFYKDAVEDDEDISNTECILKVHKPEYERCPEPDNQLLLWLYEGWKNFRQEPQIKEKILLENETELLWKNSGLVNIYEKWNIIRKDWQDKQNQIEITRDFFMDVYSKYVELQRNSEIEELIIVNGYLTDRKNPNINHAILTKRVSIEFKPLENTLYINDVNAKTELYTDIFNVMEDINSDLLSKLKNDLDYNDYHPLDRNNTKDFLKIFVRQLSSDSKYIENADDLILDNSRIKMSFSPSFILRNKIDGTGKVLEQIIQSIQNTNFIPQHLIDIISGGTAELIESGEESIEETLAKAGGESIDILLSKEANSEQLEIAKKLNSIMQL